MPFPRSTRSDTGNPGRMRKRLRIRPGSEGIGAFPAGRGKPLPYGEALANSPKVAGNAGAAAWRAGVGAPYRGTTADSPIISKNLTAAAGGVGDAAPYRAAANAPDMADFLCCCCVECRGRRSLPGGCGFAGHGGHPKFFLSAVFLQAPSPIPSPSGGGCRPQGRPERENVAGPRCGNDCSRGDMRSILPSASGQVLPLPSFAWRRMPPSPAGGRIGPLRMRRTWRISFVAAAWNAGDGVPYRAHPQKKASTSKRGLSHQGGPLFSASSEKSSRRGWSNAPARVIICQIFMDGTSI